MGSMSGKSRTCWFFPERPGFYSKRVQMLRFSSLSVIGYLFNLAEYTA
jgi:hypothetical protein